MKTFLRFLTLSAAVGTLLAPAGGARAQLLITSNDEKVSFDETGKTVTHPRERTRLLARRRCGEMSNAAPLLTKAHAGQIESGRRFILQYL